MSEISVFQAKGTPAANLDYQYAGAAGAGVVVVPAGSWIVEISAFASAAGASAQVDAGPVLPVPSGGALNHRVDGGIYAVADVTVTFVATDGYFVSWVQQT